MGIRVECASCHKSFRAKDKTRGLKTACPACKKPLVIEGVFVADEPAAMATKAQVTKGVAGAETPPEVLDWAEPASARPAQPYAGRANVPQSKVRRTSHTAPLGVVGMIMAFIGGVLLLATGAFGGYLIVTGQKQTPGQFAQSEQSPFDPGQPRPVTAWQTPPPAAQVAPKVATKQTFMVGGNGGGPFEKIVTGRYVVGFRYQVGQWAGKPIVSLFEPLSSQQDAAATGAGTLLWARDGYVVYGVDVDGTQYTNAIRVIFARLENDHIVPSDTYESAWISTPQNVAQHRLAGDGSRVIGTFGRQGLNLDAFGLLVAAEK